ncbi:MAG: OmpA family protein [Alphaproteobacteria bacterium]|nr:OmpA family protein [Alphaproteobacteria bacterium]
MKSIVITRSAVPAPSIAAKPVLRGLAGATLLLALAACERQDAPPEPTQSEAAPQPTSIMRDDLDESVLPTPQPQLAPLDARISFSDGGAELSESATAELASILRSPQIAEGGAILLRAHSDSGGSGEANMRASRRRGEAVRDYLVENGVEAERVTIIAFGEQNPLQPNARPDGTPNEPGRAANRRVDLHVALPDEDETQEEASVPASDAEPAADPGESPRESG